MPRILSLAYYNQPANWFAAVRHLPHAICLDSGSPQSQYGRFDIISAAPQILLVTNGESTQIIDGNSILHSRVDPFALLKHYLPLQQSTPAQNPTVELPFYGGAMGYFAYDLGRRLEQFPEVAIQDIALPDMHVGIYPWAIVQDHQQQHTWLVINEALAPAYNFSEIEQIARFHELKKNIKNDILSFKINKFKANINVKKYAQAHNQIQTYIRDGDCYQVNYAQRFSTEFEGDPFAAYLTLREALPSPFSAYMQLEQGAVLSLSPERFIQVKGTQVETKPIKGTIARGATPAEDLANASKLQASTKDQAENLMIVDLLRNDLSKTCNHVKVPELFSLQSFANVHHLVSTVTAELKPEHHPLDVLRSCFPGGSITGAPKIRAMEIIEELEPTRRSLYCGSIGYISTCGNMDTNIAIRTLVCGGNKMYCWGGGGIVADSEYLREYQESIAKVKVLMDTLEQHFRNPD
ncbi:MAG: aminodeoxychorismate synthase component I [Pseudomonadota bacterium]